MFACNICSKKQKGLFVGRWSKEGCINSAREYDDLKTWIRERKTAYLAARNNEWLDECCAHMAVDSSAKEWSLNACKAPAKQQQKVRTLESCKAVANKFKSPSNWYDKDSRTYIYACSHGWIEDCCVHMKKHMDSITKNMCMESATSFNNFKDFSMVDHLHFTSAKRNGWLPEIRNIYYEFNAKSWIKKNLGGSDG